jgi:hypothetical protein
VTEVSRIYHLDRGYTRMEEQLNVLGARIERVRDDAKVASVSETSSSGSVPVAAKIEP